jgi:KAP family P-loop domain
MQNLIDRPIGTSREDSLDLKYYSEALVSFIADCETPLTIGVQGDWGVGKTSLLNMVRGLLEPVSKGAGRRGGWQNPCIYVNTWQYAQLSNEDYLGISVLNGIISAIEARFPKVPEKSTAKLKHFGSMALRFAGRMAMDAIKARTAIDVEKAAESAAGGEDAIPGQMSELIENYKNEFQDLVASVVPKENDKLVIMIDDLDRVRPAKALELLESMKNFLDVPKCVFILAVDYAVIQQGVVEKLGVQAQKVHGKSYFDKIIQVPFNMPISSYRTDNYIMSLLGWKCVSNKYVPDDSVGEYFLKLRDKTLPPADVKFFTNITLLTVGANPRGIKRIVNYATLLKIVWTNTCEAKKERKKQWVLSNAKLLYSLACMQLAWPELFAYFAANPTPTAIMQFEDWDFLDSLPQLSALFARTADRDQLRSNISGFFDEIKAFLDAKAVGGNEDGIISAKEFRPIWQMMTDANLTSAPVEGTDERWAEFIKLTKPQQSGGVWAEVIDTVVDRMKSSSWNNAVRFRLLPAGKRFHNMVWDGKQVGSLATGKAEPLQFYLKIDMDVLQEADSELGTYVSECLRHFGIGDAKIDVRALAKLQRKESIRILNELLRAVTAWASTKKQAKIARDPDAEGAG